MTIQRWLCIALLLSACQGSRTSKTETSQSPISAELSHASPAAKQIAAPSEAASNAAARAGGLSWNDATPFVRRAPKSSMRAAEYGLSGDERSELAVFYFGRDQGGSVEANITRWLGQFTQADGSDSASKAKRSQRVVGGIPVTLLEVSGTYSGGMGIPGAPSPEPQQDAMLLGAVASGRNGPLFFKLVGPRQSIEHSRNGFDQLIGSLREESAPHAQTTQP